jgi:hypothetical protein
MAAKPSGIGQSRVSPGIVAIAVVVLLLVVVWIGYRALAPPPFDKPPANVHSQVGDWVRTKARESGGDINKLSPEDQQRLQSVTQGKGAAYLKKYANSPAP